jgi:hypothetical protein
MRQGAKIIFLSTIITLTVGLSENYTYAQTESTVKIQQTTEIQTTVKQQPTIFYQVAKPLEIIEKPGNFLNKNVKFQAKFDKFSTLGLDYKPAMRSSKDYISFLIRRPDISSEYTIPLSELKLIIKRIEAEKLIDLESGDEIEVTGKVFSTALSDPWMDVDKIKSLTVKKDKDKNAQNIKKQTKLDN